jgi:hypothetical protein
MLTFFPSPLMVGSESESDFFFGFGFGSIKKFWILSDSDSDQQHWDFPYFFKVYNNIQGYLKFKYRPNLSVQYLYSKKVGRRIPRKLLFSVRNFHCAAIPEELPGSKEMFLSDYETSDAILLTLLVILYCLVFKRSRIGAKKSIFYTLIY